MSSTKCYPLSVAVIAFLLLADSSYIFKTRTVATFVSSIQEKEIKTLLTSTTGQRLLSCMLLAQPLTVAELQQFPQLSFQLFDPSAPIRKPFPNVAKTSKKTTGYPEFNPIFENKELYDENRIFKRALKSGLLINVPAKKNWKKHCYYFLNPDLAFHIDSKGITISEDRKVKPITFRHNVIDYETKQEITLDDKINLHKKIYASVFNDKIMSSALVVLPNLFSLFWWLIRHPDLISKTIDVYRSPHYFSKRLGRLERPVEISDLPSGWRSEKYLFDKGLQDGVIYTDGNRVYLGSLFNKLIDQKLLLFFTPSYSIFTCFSNYQKHAKAIVRYTSARDLLKILTSEEYYIVPEKRATVFASLLLYNMEISGYTSISMNTQLAERVICGSKGPFYPFLKSSNPIDKILLFLSKEQQYILPHENG